jgi:hypothetical protein
MKPLKCDAVTYFNAIFVKFVEKFLNEMLSNLQIELLKTFEYPLPDSQLLEIKAILSNYFLDKMDTEMDKLIQENNWTQQTFIDWSKEHNRTPYQHKAHENRD